MQRTWKYGLENLIMKRLLKEGTFTVKRINSLILKEGPGKLGTESIYVRDDNDVPKRSHSESCLKKES